MIVDAVTINGSRAALWVRSSILALLVLSLSAGYALAQRHRVTLTPLVGVRLYSPFFQHAASTTFSPGANLPARGYEVEERLEISAAPHAGLNLAYSWSDAWQTFARGTYGIAKFSHVRRETDSLVGASGISVDDHDAHILTTAAGVTRRFPLRGSDRELDVGVAATWASFRFWHSDKCVPLDPFAEPSFIPGDCTRLTPYREVSPYKARHGVPGVAASVSARQHLVGRASLWLDLGLSEEWAGTDGFFTGFAPALTELSKPESTRVHALSGQLGIQLRLR